MSVEEAFETYINRIVSEIKCAAITEEEKEFSDEISDIANEDPKIEEKIEEIIERINDASEIKDFDEEYLLKLQLEKFNLEKRYDEIMCRLHSYQKEEIYKELFDRSFIIGDIESVADSDEEKKLVEKYKKVAARISKLHQEKDECKKLLDKAKSVKGMDKSVITGILNKQKEIIEKIEKERQKISDLEKTEVYKGIDRKISKRCGKQLSEITCRIADRKLRQRIVQGISDNIDPHNIAAFELKRTLRAIEKGNYTYIADNEYAIADFFIFATYTGTMICCNYIREKKGRKAAAKYSVKADEAVRNALKMYGGLHYGHERRLQNCGEDMYNDRVKHYDMVLKSIKKSRKEISIVPFAAEFSCILAQDCEYKRYRPWTVDTDVAFLKRNDQDAVRMEVLDAIYQIHEPLVKV